MATELSDLPETSSKVDFQLEEVEVVARAMLLPEEITGKPDRSKMISSESSSGLTTLSELLDRFPEATVRVPGGPGHVSSLNLGGLSGNKILVVKDGMPLNDPFTGSADIGDLKLDSFEDVEIWQGNRASLWGSNGIGGVVRLKSRFPQAGRLKLNSDGIGGNGYLLETSLEDFSMGVRLSHFSTPGWSAASSQRGNSEPDRFEVETLELALATELDGGWQAEARGSFKESMTELDGFDPVSALPVDSLTFRQKKIESDSSFGFWRADAHGEWRITQAFLQRSYTGFDETALWNEYGMGISRHRQAVSRLQDFSDGRTTGLIEVSRMETRAENRGNFSVREVDAGLLLALNRQNGKSGLLACSGRIDRPDGKKSVLTGHLDWRIRAGHYDFYLGVGSSFRNPSLNEKFYPNYGDPMLTSEHASSIQAKISRKTEHFGRLGFSMIKYRIRDLIGTVATSDPAYAWGIKAANLDRSEIISHEISVDELCFLKFHLNGSVGITDRARILSSGRNVPAVVSRRATLSLQRKFAETEVTVQSNWWGSAWENAENTSAAKPGNDLSLFISQLFGAVRLNLTVVNLLDEKKERVVGYTRPGRRFLCSTEIEF
jgi:vitamin B12 transporter